MSTFNYVIFVIAGVLCLATGASAGETFQYFDFRSNEYGRHQRIKIGGAPAERQRNIAEKLFSSAIHKQVKNDLPGAIADYLAAIKIDDKEPAVHWYLGTAYEAAGEATKAKQEFGRSTCKAAYGSGSGRRIQWRSFGSFIPRQESPQMMPLDLRGPREDGKWQTPDGQMPDGFAGWSVF
jgi:hypothetical protein